MKSKHIILISIGVVLLIAILTNPNQEAHKQEVKTKFTAYFQKSMEESASTSNEMTGVGGAFGNLLGTSMINTLVENAVKSDNYILFSITKVSWKGEENTIGVGLFGNVFLSGKINEVLNKDL